MLRPRCLRRAGQRLPELPRGELLCPPAPPPPRPAPPFLAHPCLVTGPHGGKEATCAFNTAVFTKFYEAGSTTVEILVLDQPWIRAETPRSPDLTADCVCVLCYVVQDDVGDEASSCVRFNMRATSRAGHSYDVEYLLRGICIHNKSHNLHPILGLNCVYIPPG